MYKNDLIVLVAALIISISGIVINLTKVPDKNNILVIEDKSTLLWFRILIPISLITSLFFSFSKIGQFDIPVKWWIAGLFLIACGLLIRWVAISTLGNAFTLQITINKNQHLKTTGIYRYVRHPSYTGLLLYYLGLGLIMENGVSLCLLIFFPLIAVVNRIHTEEQVLIQHFNEQYKTYQKKSWRLFPKIY